MNKERDSNTSEAVVANSPVLNALRSHIEKWYPETAKNCKLEVDDMLDEDVA